MNPTPVATPSSLSAQPSFLTTLLANRYVLPAVALVLGLIIGITMMAAVTPKPETYTKPLQAQTTSLQQQVAYSRVFALNYTILDIHYNQMSTDINANSTTGAEADATRLANSTQVFINDLKKLTIPACLKATNTALLASLTDIQQGASGLDKALVANDAGQATATAQQIQDGLSKLTTAENAYSAAVC